MRTMAMVALAALLAACGDDDDDGGGGGGTSVTLSGPVAGTLTSGTSAPVAGSCAVEGVGTVGFGGAFVAVSTAADQCSEAIAGRDVANATTLFISVVRVALGTTSSTLDAGTYPLLVGFPLPDAQGIARSRSSASRRTARRPAPGSGAPWSRRRSRCRAPSP